MKREHPLYNVWNAMIRRCYETRNKDFSNYGGRGITVCARWRKEFWNFVADMGPRSPGCEIERIDNNGNYTPTNCRWATHSEQARNRRDTRWLRYRNETMCLADWADRVGISQYCLWWRLKVGWDIERALTTPSARVGS